MTYPTVNRPVKEPPTHPALTPHPVSASPFIRKGSLRQVMSVVLSAMIFMMLLNSASGIWYAYQSGLKVRQMRVAAAQSIQVSELQLKWLAVVGTLEGLSVNRPTATAASAQIQLDLDSKLNDLESKLNTLNKTDLGISPESIAANRQVTEDLLLLGGEMRRLSAEVYDLTVRNRWSQALTRRQSGLAEMENRLDKDLTNLNKNIQVDLEASSAQVEQMRWLTSVISGGVAAATFLFAGMVLYTGRRVIIRPMQLLTQQVRQVAQGNFSAIQPLERRDEIGELSQAIALMTDWLHDSYELMEQRVVERTQEVERRRSELQISAQVARDIASARNLEALLNLAVNLIRDRFDFYHAGIFLNDDRSEYAVLRAATGEAGRDLLARQHRLHIGSAQADRPDDGIATGLVGFAAQTGEPRVALDVGHDAVHFRNPLLPNTRSEAAIPLKTAGRIIGVLDIQSIQPDAFDAETLQVFQVMADQLATAIQNARLLEEVQQNLNELRTAYGQIDRQAWERFTHATPLLGYQYDGSTLQPLTQRELTQEPKVEAEPYSVSLRVRGTEIGALEVWGQPGGLSEAETRLIANISGRLSQILESARLYEEAQARAAREQMINRLTADLARSLDTDGVLRTAAFQLGNLPSVTEATIVLDVQPGAGRKPGPTSPNLPGASASPAGGTETGGGNGHRP